MPYSDPKSQATATLPRKPSSSTMSQKTQQKYPTSLSKQGGPSRRPSKKAYPTPSIDDVVPAAPVPLAATSTSTSKAPQGLPAKPGKWSANLPLRPSGNGPPPTKVLGNSTRANIIPSASASGASTPRKASGLGAKAEYSSLQHLLEQAGYKETRVWTPPAERVNTRKVKKTFDEVDPEEVEALYSVFGIPRDQNVSHMTITEPSLPLKSSSSILRSITIQERATSPPPAESSAGSPRSVESWWGGGFAALGRAAKAVMDLSQPKQEPLRRRDIRATSVGDDEYDEPERGNTSLDSIEELHTVGLGLAKGGEGVRKVKSNWELGTEVKGGARRGAMVPEQFFSPPHYPPSDQEEDELDFNGLPTDYEAQCDDDDFYGDVYNESSSGSSRSGESRTDSREDSVDSQDWKSALAMIRSSSEGSDECGDLGDFGHVGARVMAGAVDYDEEYEDSPTKKAPMTSRPTGPEDWRLPLTAPDFSRRRRTPSPSPPPDTPEPPQPKPVLKYGDRATKLRIAKSQPALRQTPSTWFGSIKSAIGIPLLPSEYSPIPSSALDEPSKSAPAPIKLSPIAPAAPALITAVPIICDSTFQEAVDLPALPGVTPAEEEPAPVSTGVVGSIALRLRPSLAKLRNAVEYAVGIPPVPPLPKNDDGSPVLSPRVDWGMTGDHGSWSSGKSTSPTESGFASFQTPHRSHLNSSEGAEVGEAQLGDIDYTKSFFYKPPTPPHAVPITDPYAAPEVPELPGGDRPGMTKRKSIKSLRAALLIPVAPAPPPPVPALPIGLRTPGNRTPPLTNSPGMRPPLLAILSPGAWEMGLPPRELVLEGEEWDPRDGASASDWGSVRRKKSSGKKVKRKGSKKTVRQ